MAIALRAARDGANVVVLGKTSEPHPKLPGTVHSAASAIEKAGGKALGIVCDIREEDQVSQAVEQCVARFGGIDVLVNNASAIFLGSTEDTPMKRFDLMHQVNIRGTYLCGQKCIPHLRRSDRAHILTLSPPLDLRPEYFGPHVGYSTAKFGMSLCTFGWAEELKTSHIAANSLWPKTVIDTSAVRNLLGGDSVAKRSRSPSIVADAAHAILTRMSSYTGNFVTDEDVLKEEGISDFSEYSPSPDAELLGDLFLPD